MGDRRAHPPLRIDLKVHLTTTKEPNDDNENPSPTGAPEGFHSCSAPIPIPLPSRQNHPKVTTPLTAREPKGGHFPFVALSPTEPQINQSVQSNESKYLGSSCRIEHFPSTQTSKITSFPKRPMSMHDQPSPFHKPSPYIQPPLPLSPPQPMNHNPHLPQRAGRDLQLKALPRFHPANYQSSDPSSFNSRGSRLSLSQRQVSEAREKLHQYQRDLITNATKTSGSLISQSLAGKPSPPRLYPRESPGPVTPMMLEAPADYLMAGSTPFPQALSPGEGREFVERLVREENERMSHPGKRSGNKSPAVSPAGGHGQGIVS